ncbi:PAS domain S-box protein [Acetobacteraceae bacterium AT-5844]|nr:PAS domain S-box protein [Acetobacteraceae bacterium AT-5844]
MNRRLAEMTGQPAEISIGCPLAEVVPGVAEQFEPAVRRAMRGEQIADIELLGTQIGRISEGRTYLVSLEPARSEGGEIIGVLCSALDITDRKQAEKALRENQERLSNLIEQAAVGIAQTDLRGYLLLVNDRFCEIVGREREALLGMRMQDITHPDDRMGNISLFRRLAETGQPFSLEKRYVRPDGLVVWVSNYVSATRDPLGDPQFMVAIVQDITERKQAEAALSESEIHYQHATELSPHIPWIADPDGQIVEVSPQANSVLGVPFEELAGQGWLRLVHPDDLQTAEVTWAEALRSGERLDMEFRARQADGGYRWVRSRAAPRRNAQGCIVRWYGTMEDVHDRKQAEASLAESEAAFRLLFHSNPVPMWVYDQATLNLLETNDAAEQAYGWSRTALLSMTVLDLAPADQHERLRQAIAEPRCGRRISGPWKITRARGDVRLVEASSYSIDFSGRPAVLVAAWDITERLRMEEALRESEENHRYTIELSPQIPWVADASGETIAISPRWSQIMGMPPDKPFGDGWLAALHPDDLPGMKAAWSHAVSSGEPQDVEARFRVADGSYRWFRSRAAARRDKTGRVIRWYGTDEDVHERKLAEQQVAHMAYHDPLTDLANRRLFYQQLEQALAELRPGEYLAVHCIDLDYFKTVNDSLGHIAGDALLRQAADRLRGCIPGGSLVARIGGDEFAIIQAGIKVPDDAAALARRITKLLDKDFQIDGQRAVAGASVGIALITEGGTAPEEVARKADIALYRAKADGRGTFRFFERSMDEEVRRKQELRIGLRSALEHGELELHFQPLVGIEAGEVTCFEALLRWRHPEHGMISPAEFVPIAEETGMIVPMGEWVLRTACHEAARWPQPIRVAVNLSPIQFRNPGLLRAMTSALAESGLEAGRLELEITESVLLNDDQPNHEVLHELSRLGTRIVLDDFGTGFSSLSYVLRFPIDKIKIDRSFVTGLPDRRESEAVISAVVSMSRSLGISVTAEGVETAGQLEALRRLGCNDAQGYLFSRPVRAAEVAALVDKRRRPEDLVVR